MYVDKLHLDEQNEIKQNYVTSSVPKSIVTKSINLNGIFFVFFRFSSKEIFLPFTFSPIIFNNS